MWTVQVVPSRITRYFLTHRIEFERYQDTTRTFGLHRSKESLDDRDAALSSDRTEPWSDTLVPAPSLECVTEELAALVSDHMFPRCDAVEELEHLDG